MLSCSTEWLVKAAGYLAVNMNRMGGQVQLLLPPVLMPQKNHHVKQRHDRWLQWLRAQQRAAARLEREGWTARHGGMHDVYTHPEKPRQIEPLMGWTSSADMRSQVKLRFDTKEEAIAYAERNGIAYRIEELKPETRKILSYSDNFAPNRIVPWSH